MDLGRRIVVYGPAGSGKTTVSRAIGERLGLAVVELDHLFWRQSDWEEPPVEEFRERVLSHLHGLSGWVCDGNYSMVRGDILPMADAAVWLKLPFHAVYR
ncbi:MAG: (d)CMP kinase, partial [Chloroflexi bacterium]|nr:(d)CMP kinase [Chloroflexota bacterium]